MWNRVLETIPTFGFSQRTADNIEIQLTFDILSIFAFYFDIEVTKDRNVLIKRVQF
jgi:hypothetical protein